MKKVFALLMLLQTMSITYGSAAVRPAIVRTERKGKISYRQGDVIARYDVVNHIYSIEEWGQIADMSKNGYAKERYDQLADAYQQGKLYNEKQDAKKKKTSNK